MSTRCQACGHESLSPLLDVGEHPVANRFLARPDDKEAIHRLALGQCEDCATIQLMMPIPASELQPLVDWVSYREPEAHLDAFVDIVVAALALSPASSVVGISVKDDTTLERLRKRGFAQVWRLDPKRDLGIEESTVGVETVQCRLTPEVCGALTRRRGFADLVVVRHLLEHAEELGRFIGGLLALLAPQGRVLIEIPDSTRNLQIRDYTVIWEEHSFYFTQQTLLGALAHHGLHVIESVRYPYPYEDALCVIVQRHNCQPHPVTTGALAVERKFGQDFGNDFAKVKGNVRSALESWRREKGKIALFGAGHLSCAFINYFSLGDLVEFVVDDNPHKRGLFMPGARLPVVGSEALRTSEISLCLFGLAPENEDKVIRLNHAFADGGGTFGSILRGSKRAFPTRII
jgi:hypothetical protein